MQPLNLVPKPHDFSPAGVEFISLALRVDHPLMLWPVRGLEGTTRPVLVRLHPRDGFEHQARDFGVDAVVGGRAGR